MACLGFCKTAAVLFFFVLFNSTPNWTIYYFTIKFKKCFELNIIRFLIIVCRCSTDWSTNCVGWSTITGCPPDSTRDWTVIFLLIFTIWLFLIVVVEYGDDISEYADKRCLCLVNHLGLIDHFCLMTAFHDKQLLAGKVLLFLTFFSKNNGQKLYTNCLSITKAY